MTEHRPTRRVRGLSRQSGLLILVAVLQIVSAAVFVEDILSAVLGLNRTPDSWTWRETVEISATVGLVLGMALSVLVVSRLLRQRRRDAERLRAASAAFYDVVQERFSDWGLTPSERDVAFFMLRGLSNGEIAQLRNTSEGTIKAQSTAVFRKAGLSGRPQLLSLFIDEMLAETPEHDSTGRRLDKSA